MVAITKAEILTRNARDSSPILEFLSKTSIQDELWKEPHQDELQYQLQIHQ